MKSVYNFKIERTSTSTNACRAMTETR